jgi:rRNA-processing protein FCF1
VIVLDAGALLALERDDVQLWDELRACVRYDVQVVVPSAAFAQAWRGGPRQARLARALRHCATASFDELASAAGVLCGATGTADVVDASVALVAADAEVTALRTSDPDDLRLLLGALGAVHVRVLPC